MMRWFKNASPITCIALGLSAGITLNLLCRLLGWIR